MNYLALMDLLSDCGTACILINSENTIISVNRRADLLLGGRGQLPGSRLPDALVPLAEALRNAENDSHPEISDFFSNVLPTDSTPGKYARISFGRYVCCEALLAHPILPGDTRLLILRDASRDHALDMAVAALDCIHEGLVICDEEDRMYYCNPVALDNDELSVDTVRGQSIDEVYENEDMSPMVIPQVRQSRQPSLNNRQFYLTKSGHRRETIANFYPVVRNGQTLGAFSIMEDWNTASSLQRQVIDLQDRLLEYERQERLSADLSRQETAPEEAEKGAAPLSTSASKSGPGSASGSASEKDTPENTPKNIPGSNNRPGISPDQPVTGKKGSFLSDVHTFDDYMQQSSVSRNTAKLCREAAVTGSPVLLYGENGTGKNFLSQCIHNASARAGQPFLHFSCTSLPHTLLEAMLFGTAAGAYPGAEDKKGLLAQARGGTLHLSELEAMSLPLQKRLCRTLKHGTFARIGSPEEEPLDVRFILSVSSPPDKMTESQKLDISLFNLLQHTCIMVPPLRNRRADIAPLVMEFVNDYNREYGKRIVTVSDNVFSLFHKYRWSGNIKELKRAIAHAISMVPAEAQILTTEYLPPRITNRVRTASGILSSAVQNGSYSNRAVVLDRPEDGESLRDTVTELRRQSIYQVLLKHQGNITRTAQEMGLSRQNLQYHIRQCGIDLDEIRAAARKSGTKGTDPFVPPRN